MALTEAHVVFYINIFLQILQIFQLKTVITFKQKIFYLLIFLITDAPIQCASFYFERIDLASKFGIFGPKWQWDRPFSAKKSPHKFSNTDPSNLIISRLIHLKHTFSLQNQKTTYSITLKTIFLFLIFFVSESNSLISKV